eukprot:GEMP01082086.1.p1 GENE.GEMP01082086.1~~GEMP01082086.1.p1  ORF type:complete len:236 (+),score=39.20 GEMP01082086.1:147-854(+)
MSDYPTWDPPWDVIQTNTFKVYQKQQFSVWFNLETPWSPTCSNSVTIIKGAGRTECIAYPIPPGKLGRRPFVALVRDHFRPIKGQSEIFARGFLPDSLIGVVAVEAPALPRANAEEPFVLRLCAGDGTWCEGMLGKALDVVVLRKDPDPGPELVLLRTESTRVQLKFDLPGEIVIKDGMSTRRQFFPAGTHWISGLQPNTPHIMSTRLNGVDILQKTITLPPLTRFVVYSVAYFH